MAFPTKSGHASNCLILEPAIVFREMVSLGHLGRNMLIFYIISAAIGLVWGGVILRRSGLLGGCLALVLLASCFGYDFYHFQLGTLPLTSDRIVLALLSGCYIASRVWGWTSSPRIDWLDALFGGFLAMLTINTLAHNWRIDGAQPLARLLFFYIGPALMYWLVRESAFEERRCRWICGFLGLFSIYLAATALAEVNQISGAVFPSYILSSTNREWLGRARGPFLNPVTNGMFMSAGLFAWTLLWPRVNRIGKVALSFAMTLVLMGIYLTLTRSCWMGAMLGLALIVFANIPHRFRIPLGIAGLLLVSLVFAIRGSHLNSFKRDKDVSEFHMAQSAELRPMLAVVAWKIAMDYPLFGCGLGQYKQVDAYYLHDPNVDMPLDRLKRFVQHNVFLSLLTETGFIGLGFYLWLLCAWIHRAWRLWRTVELPLAIRQFGLLFVAFIANWCVNGMFHDTSLMVNANLLLFFLAGTVQGLSARAQVGASQSESPWSVRVPLADVRYPIAHPR